MIKLYEEQARERQDADVRQTPGRGGAAGSTTTSRPETPVNTKACKDALYMHDLPLSFHVSLSLSSVTVLTQTVSFSSLARRSLTHTLSAHTIYLLSSLILNGGIGLGLFRPSVTPASSCPWA